jgi:RNA recognition motif-containing protein
MNIFVGNLSRNVTDSELREAFVAFGEIASAQVIKEKFTGESRGFGFVEMPNKEEADKAIAGLNGKDLKGRTMTVNEARPRTDLQGAAHQAFQAAGVHPPPGVMICD